MAKASPMARAFNAGEFSPLMQGRVDLERYAASLVTMRNFIAAPQGPAIGRSGTAFVSRIVYTGAAALVPFVFSNTQAFVLEVTPSRIRFYSHAGLLTYAPVAAQVQSAAGAAIALDNTDLSASVGDQVALSGFPDTYGLNGRVASVVSLSSGNAVLDVNYPAETVQDGTAARVYHVAVMFTDAHIRSLRELQSVDVMYLLGGPTYKVSRFDTYDWRVERVDFVDGPYLDTVSTGTVLTPGSTGNAVPDMTSNTAPSGTASGSGNRALVSGTYASPAAFLGRGLSYELVATDFFNAFNSDEETYWASDEQQKGVLTYTPASAFVCDGYVIHVAQDNQDATYAAQDYAPSDFTFEGYDGTSWVVLDEREDYVLYDGGKSAFFEVDNTVAYQAYRLNVTGLTRNGPIEPRVNRLVMRERNASGVQLTASRTADINGGSGFLSTDVGRLLRVQGSDGGWRECKITTVNSTTSVQVELRGEPLFDTKPIRRWRLGAWSDTTGWPVAGDFFEDRLWLVGGVEFPDFYAGSVTGAYERFSPTDLFGEVLDDSAVAGRLNSRKLSNIRWVSSDSRGLLIGTGSEEYTLSSPDDTALTATNIRLRIATRRGSSEVEPARIDNQILYVQRGGRTVREFTFVFESDGYRSPSMSQLASHIGAKGFDKLEYAAEPHSIVWALRSDGTLAGLTYNREENVIGWHQHDLEGATVESLAVIPQPDQLQDTLWLIVKRRVDGADVRYVERLTRFWDFDTELADAHFVDSGLRYTGEATSSFYGLEHLEGETVYGLADAKPVGPFTVTNGSVTLPFAASNVVVGLGFESLAVLPRLENGARDGTAQGKQKRINSLVVNVWRSFGGEIGLWNEQEKRFVFEPLAYEGDFSALEDIALYTGLLPRVTPALGYDMEGLIAFRRRKDQPLPFNVSAIMPQLNTQDR